MELGLLARVGAISKIWHSTPPIWRVARPDRIIVIELKQRLPLIALFIGLFWYLVAPADIVLVAIVALASLVLVAFLWARAMAREVSARRELRYLALQVGDEIEELVTLDNQSRLPVLWAEFLDRSNLPGHTVSGVSTVDGRSSYQWRAHQICSRRGVFVLGPWELELGDPFGFFLVRQTYTDMREIVVHPSLAALPPQLLRHEGITGDSRPLREPVSADTNSAYTTRPYVAGDPLRFLHWRTTARHDSPFVKTFEPEAASDIWLVPDLDASVHWGETEEAMVTLVASLAAHFLHQGFAVGLFQGGDECAVIPPQRGTAHLWAILRALASLHTLPGHSLERTLSQARPLVGPRHFVVVITPSTGTDWISDLLRLTCSHHRGAAQVILLDPASFGDNDCIEPCLARMTELGLNAQIIRRQDLQPIAGAYGALSRWEFATGGTGGVVVKRSPRRAPTLAAQLNNIGGQRAGSHR